MKEELLKLYKEYCDAYDEEVENFKKRIPFGVGAVIPPKSLESFMFYLEHKYIDFL